MKTLSGRSARKPGEATREPTATSDSSVRRCITEKFPPFPSFNEGDLTGKLVTLSRTQPPDDPTDALGGMDRILADNWLPNQMAICVLPAKLGYTWGRCTLRRSKTVSSIPLRHVNRGAGSSQAISSVQSGGGERYELDT
jgi:hypothetical protein